MSAGTKIIEGLKEAIAGKLDRVTIEGQVWTRAADNWQPIETGKFALWRAHLAKQRVHGNPYCSHMPEAADVEVMMDGIERLREALRPLAGIALWSDAYADCKNDHICDYNLSRYFTIDEVKAARAALGQASTPTIDDI